ncbi:MAG: homoserine kinase [Anaerolineaceae bacterium]|nr:homoserine kinase [Anaerolineaceae bacterium]
MLNASAEAFAPATVANLGVGFDILGLALREPGDVVRVEHRDEPGAAITLIEGDGGKLPHDPDQNTACIAANTVLKTLGVATGVAIRLYKHLPLASGLGSSAASAVAAAVAVNALFGEPLTRPELLPACLDGEAAVSGWHADNVGPSLFGGITLITGTDNDQIRNLPVPQGIFLALVTPAVAVPTAEARAVLPKMVSLHDMVAQTGAVARLMDAIYRADVPGLARAMEQDSIIEPARAHLMPKLAEVRAVARQAGALGLVISGAGPSLCAVCDTAQTAQTVAVAMKKVYDTAEIESVARHTTIAIGGAQVLRINDQPVSKS